MSNKIWVKVSKVSAYEPEAEWKLGTIVGKTSIPYANSNSLQELMQGAKLSKRYLIELDDGNITEAWYWDVYEPVEHEKMDGRG